MAWPDEKEVRKAILGHKVVFWLYGVSLGALVALAYTALSAGESAATGNLLLVTSILFPLAIFTDFIERTKHFHEVASVKLLTGFAVFLLATYGAVMANIDIGAILHTDASSAKVSFTALTVYHGVLGTAKGLVLLTVIAAVPLSVLSIFPGPVRRFRDRRRAQLSELERNLRVSAPGSGRTRRFRNFARIVAILYVVSGVALLDPAGPNHRTLVSTFVVLADFFPNQYCDNIAKGTPVLPTKEGKALVALRAGSSGMYSFAMKSCQTP